MSTNKEDRSFKTLINRETTDSDNKFYFNEFGADTINVHIDDIWSETIPYNNPTAGVSSGRVQQQTLFVLTVDPTVPNSQSWKAGIQDWISPKYGDNYTAHLFDGDDNEIFPTDPLDWFFDYQTGILTFNNTLSRPTPLKITGYRYIGYKGSRSQVVTQSDMTVEINYSTGVDPDPNTIFLNQYDIDAHGSIKHFMAFWDALPPLIKHTITVNLSAEDHYPRSSDTDYAWPLDGKTYIGGNIILNGGLPSTYIPVDGSLVDLVPIITQTGSNNPYMTFSGTPFTGFDLHGQFVVFDTGQVTIIHDHDDSTLYFIDDLSPTPTSVSVARPSTRFLNDDGFGSKLAWATIGLIIMGSTNTEIEEIKINNLVVAPYGGHGIYINEGNTTLTCILLDNTIGPSEYGIGFFITGFNSTNFFVCCSRLNTPGSIPSPSFPIFMAHQATVITNTAYFRGGASGILARYDDAIELRMIRTILDNVGTDVGVPIKDRGSIVMCGGHIRLSSSSGKINEIRNGTTYGILFRDGGSTTSPTPPTIIFKNMSAPCIFMSNKSVLDSSIYGGSLINGGGNTDVGIQLDGPHAEVILTSGTDVTGSIGDVRMGDGSIWSYSLIQTYGPIIDSNGNIIEVV